MLVILMRFGARRFVCFQAASIAVNRFQLAMSYLVARLCALTSIQ